MQPVTIDDWLEVATERAADAEAILATRRTSIGSVYLVGYGIECCLKAFLKASGRPFPQAGATGHNLTALWKSSGLRKSDIGGHGGCNTFYLESWNTALRYSGELDAGGITHEELVQGAKRITGWVSQQTRRKQMRKRRGRR